MYSNHLFLRFLEHSKKLPITVSVVRDGICERWEVSDFVPIRKDGDSPIDGWTVVCLEQIQRDSLGHPQSE